MMDINYIKNTAVNLAHKWILGKKNEAVEQYCSMDLGAKEHYALGRLIETYVLCIERQISRHEAVQRQKEIFMKAEELEL